MKLYKYNKNGNNKPSQQYNQQLNAIREGVAGPEFYLGSTEWPTLPWWLNSVLVSVKWTCSKTTSFVVIKPILPRDYPSYSRLSRILFDLQCNQKFLDL